MVHTNRKLKNKIWSLALCASMIVSCLPISAFAETDSGLCEHHHEHTAECGYVAAVDGQPCTHEHTDDCYSIVKCVHEHDESCGENGESCTHVCSEESGCITVKHNCYHTHDENCGYGEGVPASDCTHECSEECTEGCIHEHDEICGYAEETEATPCTHVCSIEGGCYEPVCSHAVEGQHDDSCGYVAAVVGSPCKYECEEDHGEEESTETVAPAYTAEGVKAMIDALPTVSELENMDSDELNSVYEQAQKAYDAFETLMDEEQMELADELVKLRDVLDFMTTPVTPLATEAGNLPTPYVTYSEGVTQYFKYNNYLYKITYTNLSWSSVKLSTYTVASQVALRIVSEGTDVKYLLTSGNEYLYTKFLPTTQGAELICYDVNGKIATITCLELNENPTWNWASDYSSAQVVFTAKNYDVCATVNAGVSTVIDKKATNCLEKDTVTYTGSVSFGGSTYTDKKTAANGAIGSHSFTYSVSGNVITESCSNNCGHKETATLTVDATASLLYTGSAVKPLKVEYSADWQGGELSISYTDDCVALGTHSGSITIGGVTATKDFVVTTSTLVTEDNYKSLGLDSSYIGYYTISTLSELYSFAAVTKDNPSANAVLLKNIDMENRAWTPIGTESIPYTGIFDGNGKTISNLSITAASNNQGLFGVVNGGTVKNFTINGTIVISATASEARTNIGGAVGYAYGGATITGITSRVNINDTDMTSNANTNHIGGVVGYVVSSTVSDCTYNANITMQVAQSVAGVVGLAEGTAKANNGTIDCYIARCTNYGTIKCDANSKHIGGIAGDANNVTRVSYCVNSGNVNSGGADCVGGVVSYANDYSRIEYCANLGTVTCSNSKGGYIGGILGYINASTFGGIISCYNYGSIITNSGSDNHAGAIIGWNRQSNTNKVSSNNYYLESSYTQAADTNTLSATAMTAEQFSSGEVAYLLNGSTNAGLWKLTIGTDKYPNFTGKDVYGGYVCGSGNSNMVYRNSMDGLITFASPNHDYDDAGTCKNCGTSKAAVWNKTENLYEIHNEGQLQWFADYVNAGNTGINGKLMADIDASTLTTLAIGVKGKAYSGIFDANGYTLTIGLNSTAEYAAPFQYVNGATIKNLTVKGSITTNQKFAASIVGQSTGSTTIENCLSYVTINSTLSGDGTHGGLVANVSSGTMTINNCGFVGAINGSDTTNCGGLVGWSNGTTNISNSFVAASFTLASGDNYTFSRNKGKVSLTNCYYLNALGTAQGTPMTADQLTSGELAWLLNGSKDNGSWKQTLGENGDATPNFSGGAVYKLTPCETGYTNNESEKNNEHDFNEQGFCKDCNGYQPAVWNNEDNVYEISNAGQLIWFAGLVNGTLGDVAQNQSANAILKNDLDMSGITGYVPIGGTTGLYYSSEGTDKGYRGTFDGNGHVIKNLSITGSNTAQLTYGVFGTLSGTVKHLGVENFTFTLGSQDCCAGGIAGQMLSGSLITDCYVANSTITATGKVVGGIAGCNYAGTIQNCFTYKVTVTATRSGGIVGNNRGDGGADDRKGTVINCYTDAGTVESSDRAGNVTASKANVGTTDFSSGLLAWSLNTESNDGVWKQTIGTHGFPCFDGNDLSFNTGDYADSDNSISLQIIWTSLEFTYYAGEWDASVHTYTGGGYWKTDMENGDVITIRNTGNTAVRINLSYESSLDGVAGVFDKNGVTLNDGEILSSKLALSGTPSEGRFTDKEIGRISISIEKSLKVGETVTYNGYECTVLEIRDGKYILMTSTHVKEYGTGRTDGEISSLDDIPNWVASVAARLPDANYATEKSAMRAIMNANRGAQFYAISNWISESLYVKFDSDGYMWYNKTVAGTNRQGILVYLVFEVPCDYDF